MRPCVWGVYSNMNEGIQYFVTALCCPVVLGVFYNTQPSISWPPRCWILNVMDLPPVTKPWITACQSSYGDVSDMNLRHIGYFWVLFSLSFISLRVRQGERCSWTQLWASCDAVNKRLPVKHNPGLYAANRQTPTMSKWLCVFFLKTWIINSALTFPCWIITGEQGIRQFYYSQP